MVSSPTGKKVVGVFVRFLKLSCIYGVFFVCVSMAQNGNQTIIYQFHKERRAALRTKLPQNSVALFLQSIRNRANDVDFIFHQDPDFII
jgi:Xaa-Pro aminopeptidase